MARRHETTPDRCDAKRLAWLVAQLAAVGDDRLAAAESGSHSAVAAMRREERALRDQIDRGRMQLEEEARAASREDLTPQQKADLYREKAETADDAELEVALQVWLKRRRYDLAVDARGVLQLVPQGDSRPGLRLVSG